MTLELQSPLDMHLHLREGAMLECVAPLSAETFAGAVIMPNLVPPVDNLERLLAYRAAIHDATRPHTFEPYMTLFMRSYEEAELAAAREQIIGIKLYPAGVTTNSEAGLQGIADAYATLAIMEEMNIPLMVHGETMGFVMDREREFLSVYEGLAERFPRLRITMEHISTREAVALLDRHENLRATVTLHHLVCTLDDLAGGKLAPHLFCKPILKRPEDREALLKAALEAHPKLMFGSDSAPHPVDQKECCGCAAGVFTAPHALAMLADLFERHGALDRLQAFVSDNARELYDVTPPSKTVHLEKKEYRIPVRHGEMVPFRAGETLAWSVRTGARSS